jgi:hypothetical protein
MTLSCNRRFDYSKLRILRWISMAEAAVAKEQAEYDRLIAQMEKDRKQREAQEMLERSAAQARHEHDIVVLAARKLEAVAQAKLEAIERPIIQEEDDLYSGKSGRKASVEASERTKARVESQPPFEGEVVRKIKREVNDESIRPYPIPRSIRPYPIPPDTDQTRLLTRLQESARFGEYDKKKLQTFSDLCSDVVSQVSQLPGLACLDYPNAFRPILDNLLESLCNRWDKQVVEFTLKNEDAYPDFTVFASMIEKQSLFKNHPNVTAFEKRGKGDRRKPFIPPFIPPEDPLHTVLAGEAKTEDEEVKEKHCPFHKCIGHTLSECKSFA